MSAHRSVHLTANRDPARLVDARLRDLHARALPDGALLFVAGDRRSRARGLAGLQQLAPHHALLLEPCRSVHTIGMRFALDLLWLDARGALVRIDRDVAPRRLRGCRAARAVLECNAGEGERYAALVAADAGC